MNSNRVTKEELRHDSFVAGTAKATAYVQQHFMTVLVVVAALAVIVLGLVFFQQSGERDRLQAEQLLYRIASLYSEGSFSESLLQVSELEERFGGSDQAHTAGYFAGAAHLALSENDQAIERFTAYLDDAPKGNYAVAARVGLGLAQESRGDLEAAVVTFQAALDSTSDLNPLQSQAALAQSRVLQALGRIQDAIAVLEPLREGADAQSAQEIEARLATLEALR